MSGGTIEHTANVIPSGHEYISRYGGEIANIKSSNKYVTLYPLGNSTQEETDISRSYMAWSNIYGDAVWEISSGYEGDKGWNNDNIDIDTNGDEAFLFRGSKFNSVNNAGIFALGDSWGRIAEDSTGNTNDR